MEDPSPPDEVVAVEVRWRPSIESAKPLLFQDDNHAVVIFDAARPSRDIGILTTFRDNVSKPTAPSRRVEVRFEECLIAKFGHPSDDARSGDPRSGDPRYEGGLRSYGLFEVRNSSWTSLLTDRNKVSHPGVTWPPYPLRHFILTFKDATFECLCGAVLGRVTELSVAQILESLIR